MTQMQQLLPPVNHAYLYIKNAVREADDLLLTGTSDGYVLTSKRAAAGSGGVIYLSCEYGTRIGLALGIGGGVGSSYWLNVYSNTYVSGSRTTKIVTVLSITKNQLLMH